MHLPHGFPPTNTCPTHPTVDGCKHGKVDQEVLMYIKAIYIFVKHLKVVAKCCLIYFFFYFHDDLFYFFKYSNVEYQVDIFKTCVTLHRIFGKEDSSLLHENTLEL